MFNKVVFILSNNKKVKIKSKDIEISDLDIKFFINLKYYGYFSTQETTLKEGYFSTLFKKSRHFIFDQDVIPEYEIKNGKLLVKTKLEEF